ncbi:hypothetical protein [uncultured Microbulbifer sp.]|uniref:hypothetical protein n=1 Tax=uncultured Microbulbifer sp. TaxID=348147 RepID=UPI00260C6397|nr:hypothetical protein [uncultured Microbulbifer sp.]
MKKPVIQFVLSILFVFILCKLIGASETELWAGIFIGAFIFVGVPVLILSWVDFGSYLRSLKTRSWPIKLLGFIFGIPQALIGLASLGIGVGIVIWVLYNSFIERQEEYTGGFMSLGMSPMFIGFGLLLLVSAFKRSRGA